MVSERTQRFRHPLAQNQRKRLRSGGVDWAPVGVALHRMRYAAFLAFRRNSAAAAGVAGGAGWGRMAAWRNRIQSLFPRP